MTVSVSIRRQRLTPLWLLLPALAVLVPMFAYPLYQLGLLSCSSTGNRR